MKNARIASSITTTATVIPIFMSVFEKWVCFVACVEGELVNAPEGVAEVCVDVLLDVLLDDSRDAPGYEEDDGVEMDSVTEGMEVMEEERSTGDWINVSIVKG